LSAPVREDAASALGARLWRASYLLLTLVALMWAGNALVGRASRDLVPPLTLAFVRWAGALVIVLPFALPHLKADLPALKAKAGIVAALGVLGVALFNALLYSGVHYTTATNALLIQAAIPPLIILFAFLLFGERSGVRQLGAVALSLAGVVIVVSRGDPEVLLHFRVGLGEALVLAAVAVWALYTALLRLRPTVHPFSLLSVTFAIGVLLMAPAAAFEAWRGERVIWNGGALGAMAYVAVFPSVAAYLLFNRGVELIGAARAGQFINLMPLFGAVLAVLLLGEPLAPYHLVGGGLIVAGVVGYALADRRAARRA
jgi:drug/metabolite transporter (DMT)-like permease